MLVGMSPCRNKVKTYTWHKLDGGACNVADFNHLGIAQDLELALLAKLRNDEDVECAGAILTRCFVTWYAKSRRSLRRKSTVPSFAI